MVISPQNTLIEGLFGFIPMDGGLTLPAGDADFATIIMQLMGSDTVPVNSEKIEIMVSNDMITEAVDGLSDIKSSAVTSENETSSSVQARLIIHTPDGEEISIPITLTGFMHGEYGELAVTGIDDEKPVITISLVEPDTDSKVTPFAVLTPADISEKYSEPPSLPEKYSHDKVMIRENMEVLEESDANEVFLVPETAHRVKLEVSNTGISNEYETDKGVAKTDSSFPSINKTLQENETLELPEKIPLLERNRYRSIHLMHETDDVGSSYVKNGKTVQGSLPEILPHRIQSTHSEYSVIREISNGSERNEAAETVIRVFNASEKITTEATEPLPTVTVETADYTHDGSETIQAPQKRGTPPVIMVQTDGGKVPVAMSISGSSLKNYPVITMLEELLASGAQVEIVLDITAESEKASVPMLKEPTGLETSGTTGSETVVKFSEIKQTDTGLSGNNQKRSFQPHNAESEIRHINVKSSVTGTDNHPADVQATKYTEEYSTIKYTNDFVNETHPIEKIVSSKSDIKWSSGGVGTVSKPANDPRTFTRTPVNPPGTINNVGEQETVQQADSAEYSNKPSGPQGNNESVEGSLFKFISEPKAAGHDVPTGLSGRQVHPYRQNNSSGESPYVTTETGDGTTETQKIPGTPETQRADTELSTKGTHESNSVPATENRVRADGTIFRTERTVHSEMNDVPLKKQTVENTINLRDTDTTTRQSAHETTVHTTNSSWINGTGTGTGDDSSDYLYPADTTKSAGVKRDGGVLSVTESSNKEGSTRTEIVGGKVRPQEIQSQKIPLKGHEFSGEVIDGKDSFIHEESGNTNKTVKISREMNLSSTNDIVAKSGKSIISPGTIIEPSKSAGEVNSLPLEGIVSKNDTNTIPPGFKIQPVKSSGAVTTGNTSEKNTVFSPEPEFSSAKPERVMAKHTVVSAEISESVDTVRSESRVTETSSNRMGTTLAGDGESQTHAKYPVTQDVSVPANLPDKPEVQTDSTSGTQGIRKDVSLQSEKQGHTTGNENSIISNTSRQNSEPETVEHIPAPVFEENVQHDPYLKSNKVSAEGNSNKEAPVVDKTGGAFVQSEGESALNSEGGRTEDQSQNFESISFDDDGVYSGRELAAQTVENRSLEMSDNPSRIIPPAGIQNESVISTEKVSGQFRITSENMTPQETENRLMNTIVRNARFMISGGQSSAEIKLEPPNLGKMKIEIVTENSKIIGKITVESHEIKEMIQTSISSLKEQLSESGLKVESFDVQVGHNGGTDSWAQREHAENLKLNFQRNIDGYKNASGETLPATGETNYSKSLDSDYLDVLI